MTVLIEPGDVSSVVLTFGFRKPHQAAAWRNRVWAIAKTVLSGEAEAMAILMRRTLIVTSAPSFKSLSRMVPAVAWASSVPTKAMRRKAVMST